MSIEVVKYLSAVFAILFSLICSSVFAENEGLLRLKDAYPDHIISVNDHDITWRDGTTMPVQRDNNRPKTPEEILNHPDLLDALFQRENPYIPGIPKFPEHFNPQGDPGRIRYEPLFLKMYGKDKNEVESHLTTIYWMPDYFGKKYPLKVTRVNHVDALFTKISQDLEDLVAKKPEYLIYLDKPAGTFCFRKIANSDRISMHSFGMTIDINTTYSNYWQWDLEENKFPIDENSTHIIYHNQIPWEIVAIFEKYKFIWGGKWRHYDTMHFEYRPELFPK